MNKLKKDSNLANKKALNYEDSFDIPVDDSLSENSHTGLYKSYHFMVLLSSGPIKNTLAWTGRDLNPHLLCERQLDYRYPTGPNPARVTLDYQLPSSYSIAGRVRRKYA